jgi:hypothetical protein
MMMCPRGDLNPHGREISPDRGNHKVRVAGFCPCVHAIRVVPLGCDRVFLWLKRRTLGARCPYAGVRRTNIPVAPQRAECACLRLPPCWSIYRTCRK